MKKYVGIFLAAVVMISLSLAYSVTAWADGTTGGVIANGVFIGDVDVSGMTADEAKDAVEAYVASLSEVSISLNAMNDNYAAVTADEIGLAWGNESVVDEALQLGQGGNLVERYKAKKDLEFSTVVLPVTVLVDRDKILSVIQDKCEAFNVEATDAYLTRVDGQFVIEGGLTGVVIDEEASADAVAEYLETQWDYTNTVVDLVVQTTDPIGNREDLEKVQDVLGTFTTDYSTSSANRCGNVANGCSLINGSTIYPGEEFSVYSTVSPFTTENGYFMAGSYLNGQVVESLGGGICQVSTTLYNAVLLAELDVKQRMNHSMIVTYVDPSMDAAISGTEKDFKFVNNTDYPIYIEGYTENKTITFTIYGVETRPANREVVYESKVLSRQTAEGERVVADPSKGAGYINVTAAHTGMKAELWKVVKVDGVEESRELVNSSDYAATPRTASVGTATSDPVLAANLNAAIATQSIAQVRAVLAGGTVTAPDAAAQQAAAQQAAAQQAAQQAAEAAAAQQAAQQAAAEAAAQAAAQAGGQ